MAELPPDAIPIRVERWGNGARIRAIADHVRKLGFKLVTYRFGVYAVRAH
jgi:hypothetical protein